MLLRDFVNKKIASADKEASAEGVPLTLNNCKKYKKMRDLKVYGNCFQDGTPTPENPIEVQCVGEKSVNLFDFENARVAQVSSVKYEKTDNSYVIDRGNSTSGNLKIYFGKAVDFVGETLCMSVEHVSGVSTYTCLIMRTPDGVVIDSKSTETHNGNVVISTLYISEEFADNDIEIRLYCANANTVPIEYKNIQVEIGSTATEFIPYGKYRVPIVQRGKNLANPKAFQFVTISGVTLSYLEDEKCLMLNGTADSSGVYFRIVPQSINESKGIYSISALYLGGSVNSSSASGALVYLAEADDVGGVYNWFYTELSERNTYKSKALTKQKVSDIRLRFEKGTVFTNYKFKLQFEKSPASTEFEPHVEPITTNIYLDEPLRKVGIYADYIDGRNKKLHRLLYEYYLDGSQTVSKYNDNICIIHTNVRCKNYAATTLSNRFRHGNYVVAGTAASISTANATGNRVQISHNKFIDGVTDAETLKQWLTENPTTFIQPLETPIEEPLNIELPKLNAKTTIIEVDTSLAPSNISGKYIIR